MESAKIWGTILLSLSLICLALALAYFAWEASKIRRDLPGLMEQFQQAIQNVDPVLKEVEAIRETLPDILGEVASVRKTADEALQESAVWREQVPPALEEVRLVREQMPGILSEVEKTREALPPLLDQVEKTRESIPPILAELRQTREAIPPILDEVKAVRQELPHVYTAIEQASGAVETASAEIAQVRPLVPPILEEVKSTREALPDMLDQADGLAQSAKEIGREAGKGAVGGFFSGVIGTPFRWVGAVGDTLTGWTGTADPNLLTAKDRELMGKAVDVLLERDRVGGREKWKNSDSKNSGDMKLLKKLDQDGKQCRILEFNVSIKGKKGSTEVLLCKEEGGDWKAVERGKGLAE